MSIIVAAIRIWGSGSDFALPTKKSLCDFILKLKLVAFYLKYISHIKNDMKSIKFFSPIGLALLVEIDFKNSYLNCVFSLEKN